MFSVTKRLIAVTCVVVLLLAFAPAALAQGVQPGESVLGAAGVSAATGREDKKSFYLAEGCTRDGFETWLSVFNCHTGYPGWGWAPKPPNPYWKLKVSYITNEGVVATKTYDLPTQSRTTINVNAEIGAGYDVAFKLEAITNCPSDYGGIWVERPMYFNYVGTGGHIPWQGGHVNWATYSNYLTTQQYFAEGTTRQDSERQFDEWLCVLNPNDQPAHLTFNYMIQGEGLTVKTGVVKPNHRATWYVPDHVGLDKDVSLELVSDVKVLAERPMYFNYRSVNPQRPGRSWYGGHVSTGLPVEILDPPQDPYNSRSHIYYSTRTFAFAPVVHVPGMGWADTWVCLQNANEVDVPVKITFSTPGGLMAFIKWLPAQQRSTFYYPQLLAEFGVASSREPGSFRVELIEGYPRKILVEKPLYMEFERPAKTGQLPSGGTVTRGATPPPGASYSEGYTGAGFDTYLVFNRFEDSEAVRERWEQRKNTDPNGPFAMGADCYFPARAKEDHAIPIRDLVASGYQGAWYTYVWHVNDDFPGTDISFEVRGVYVERVMIFSYAGKWSGVN